MNSAVGGGNTDANRPVGVPYPFKAAASKQGDHSGGTNETVLRLMNKSALVNCRWTIRPVLPDGQSVPGKAGAEISNMDYIFLEQASCEPREDPTVSDAHETTTQHTPTGRPACRENRRFSSYLLVSPNSRDP